MNLKFIIIHGKGMKMFTHKELKLFIINSLFFMLTTSLKLDKVLKTTIILLIIISSCSKKPANIPINEQSVQDSLVSEQNLPTEPVEKIVIEKDFLYDKYTLEDVYPYKDTTREFQWDKIQHYLEEIEDTQKTSVTWGILQNRNNVNGEAPLARNVKKNAYKNFEDPFGVERFQSAPLYLPDDISIPERYGEDGSLIKVITNPDSSGYLLIEAVYLGREWKIPAKYVKIISDTVRTFHKVIFIDRTNQNIVTLEKSSDSKWLVRSMNPATTGLRHPPHQYETPLGIFVIQEKKVKMFFLEDGTSNIAGFSPYASRFSNGGYLHGIPVNYPRKTVIEYSKTLGTIPRSHKCIRNATSHAQFLFDWAPIDNALVVVFD